MRGARLHALTTSHGASMQAAAEVVADARNSLLGEVFVLDHPSFVRSLNHKLSDGVTIEFLVDPERRFQQSRGALERARFETPVGASRKVHSKAFSADDASGIVMSMAPLRVDADILAFGARLKGPEAAALSALTRAGLTDDTAQVQRAAAHAARLGVVQNDAYHGVRHVTDGLESTVDGAGASLLYAPKAFTDMAMSRRLVEAAKREVAVTVVTRGRRMKPAVRKHLSGVRNLRLRLHDDPRMHGNALIADGARTYVGSAHATPRALGREGTSRLSRELGVLFDDRDRAGQVREAIEQRLTGDLAAAW